MTKAVCATIALAALVLAFAATAEAATYEIRVLDYLPYNRYAGATDINSSNLIVGYCNSSYQNAESARACWWDESGVHSLGATFDRRDGAAINDSGDIVAGKYVWRGGAKTALPQLVPAQYSYNTLTGIGDNGAVVGESYAYSSPNSYKHACLWDAAGVHDLDADQSYFGDSTAYEVNRIGQVTGVSNRGHGPYTAMLWQNGTARPLGFLRPDDQGSAGLAINDGGTIVGYTYKYEMIPGTYSQSCRYEAFFWDGTSMQTLAVQGKRTQARDINNLGQIVGYSCDWDWGFGYRATLWENGVPTELPTLGGDCLADAINDNGWIVGQAYGLDQQWHAVVWVPVPEPASLIALLAGIAPLANRLRRRTRIT